MKRNTIILIWLLLGAVFVYKSKVNGVDWLKETARLLIQPAQEAQDE